jgi:protein-S-isoprenylcysteine O-methyltransferase Ste14
MERRSEAVTARVSSQNRTVAERLARRRVPLGFLSALVVMWLARPTGVTLACGSAIAVAGEALRIWAAGHLNKSREVTSSGPYRWFAHPLYVGSAMMGAGLAVASNSLGVAVIIVIYLGATIGAAIRTEEAFLRRTFGADYDRYRRGAGVVHRAASPDGSSFELPLDGVRRFSIAQAMANREYRAVSGLAVAMLLLLLKATYNGTIWRAAGTSLIRPGG